MKKNLFTIMALMALVFVMNSCGTKSNEVDNGADSLEVQVFNYTPTEPVNGTKKAVMVLGANGFDMFIVEIDKESNWKLLRKEFGKSLVSEDKTTTTTIKQKLQGYIKEIVDNNYAAGKDIHFVVSSGAKKENSDFISDATKVLKDMGYVVNEVTPEQESEYAYLSIIPKGYEDKSFVVDIGSGNTKVAWKSGGKIMTEETYGAKYNKKGINDKQAYDDAKTKMSTVPAANAETLFILGGVPFKMANTQKKGKERYTVLSTDYAAYDSLANAEGDKMKAGLNIYAAIIKATGTKQVVFDWDANFAIGFLIKNN